MLSKQFTTLFKAFLVAFLILGGTIVPAIFNNALADTMSSASYQIQADTLSIGGNQSTSTGYVIEDTIGEMATGGGISSASFSGCAGYQCFVGADYISFSIKEGTSSPGTVGAGIDLGVLTTASVFGSNGSSINSIFITAESTAGLGSVVTVTSSNEGLASVSAPADVIDSATASLVAGTEGYGVCVTSSTEGSESPSSLDIYSPYSSTCNTGSGHSVGIVDSTARTILGADAELADGSAEILLKAAISDSTEAHSDYADDLVFIMTGTF